MLAAAFAVVTVFVVGTALPAWAHHPVLSGTSVCSDGEHVITWTIGNSEPVRSMHVDTAVATLGADTFAVTGYAPDIAGTASTTGTTTVPGGSTGTVTLTVHSTWTDGVTAIRTTTVTLSSVCTGPTTTTTVGEDTTTTIGEDTTTTTVGEDTTTTIGENTTSTAVEGETTTSIGGATTSTTDSPVGPQGSTSPLSGGSTSTSASASPVTVAATPPGSLPFTGGSSNGPIFGLVTLAAGGLALAFASRRNRSRDS